jgi:ergothioneine biosynthesis protein EgtB
MTITADAQQWRSKEKEYVSDPSSELLTLYQKVRSESEYLCEPLAIEDYGIQTMPDVSPPKWHLAHVTWFFETFLLTPFLPGYRAFHPKFHYLFNSYYETVGTFHPRPQRGLLSRPTVDDVFQYRDYVNEHMLQLLQQRDHRQWEDIHQRTLIGIHHEQQHQELLLTDIKHIFGYNPLRPIYRDLKPALDADDTPLDWIQNDGGLVQIGHDGKGFSYDNEMPRHKVYVAPFSLASRPVTNGEYLEFIADGGYRKVELWLSDAWKTVTNQNWQAPLYWEYSEGCWHYMTLAGMQPVNEQAPVCHVSYFEADAYARWAGYRLPGESEWEIIATDQPPQGNLRETGYLQPVPAQDDTPVKQMYGDVWEWTQSVYGPYPGYQPLAGSLGEYNGKFMCNQMVLRGGSCFTPTDHIRATYRNFFYPKDRWQMSGFRLAKDLL